MKIQFKFALFIGTIHIIFLLFSLLFLESHPFLFFAAEIFILISLVIFFYFYKSIVRPVQLLSVATENIHAQNFSSKLIKSGPSELDQLVDVYNQMIDQLRLERVQHKEQLFLLNELIHASPAGIILLDIDEKIETINPAAENFLDLEKGVLLKQSLGQFSGPLIEGVHRLQPNVAQTISPDGFHTYKCQKSHFMDRGCRRHFILIEEFTDAILQSEKNAYERVIRMMSHEVNNSIGAVNSILHLLQNYHSQIEPDDQEDFQEVIEVSLDRNTRLNQFMSNFAEVARIPQPTKSQGDLHKLLERVHTLLFAESRERRIQWEWQLEESPFLIEMDTVQMEQVFLNIFKNALEAIEAEGNIVIQTSFASNPWIKVIDSGKGISSSDQAKLFTPFFSTKKYGQGIGLTLIREILLNHGFHFSLSSNAQGNTEFLIRF